MLPLRDRSTFIFLPAASRAFIILFLVTWSSQALAQGGKMKRWIKEMLLDTSSSERPSFRMYPTVGYAPETNVEIGLSALLLFHARNDTSNRISEVQGYAFATFKGQYGFIFNNAYYSHRDRWFILGKVKVQSFPLLFYGIGPNTSSENAAVVHASYVTVRERVLPRIAPNLFLGPEIDFQYLYNTRLEHRDQAVHADPVGVDGSANLGGGVALVYDNRRNVLNVRNGLFAELSFLSYNRSLASDFSFNFVNADIRGYHSVNKRDVLAWQALGNFISGEVPFNQMAMMGGEMMMRGYYIGRFRDKNLLAAQAEYRMLPFPFSKRFGGAVFAAASVVAPEARKFVIGDTKFAGGAGVRYLLFPRKDIYMRFDVGFTRDGIGFYIYTGEAF